MPGTGGTCWTAGETGETSTGKKSKAGKYHHAKVLKTGRFCKKAAFFEIILLKKRYLFYDIKNMDIQSVSVEQSQQRVQEEAAVKTEAAALEQAEIQGSAVVQLIDSAAPPLPEVVTDPRAGNQVDLLA
jgi:hypothetical protein